MNRIWPDPLGDHQLQHRSLDLLVPEQHVQDVIERHLARTERTRSGMIGPPARSSRVRSASESMPRWWLMSASTSTPTATAMPWGMACPVMASEAWPML